MEPHADQVDVIRSVSVKVYQKNSDETFILKQPLQHLVLLETTIKDPKNEKHCSRRGAAMKYVMLMQYVNWLCYELNPRSVCLDYSESLHACNIYFLDISFAEFFVYVDLLSKDFFCWNQTRFEVYFANFDKYNVTYLALYYLKKLHLLRHHHSVCQSDLHFHFLITMSIHWSQFCHY